MKVKADLPLSLLSKVAPSALIAAYFEINQLKQLYRQGWLRRGIPPERCESVADHVFGMALFAWWVVDNSFPALDRDKVIRMVLVHEIGEVYAGDLTPADQVSKDEKHALEHSSFQQVVSKLPHGNDYLALWEAYEENATPEARLVHQIDRLEMALQASIYEHQSRADMSEFFESSSQAINDEVLRRLFDELQSLRP